MGVGSALWLVDVQAIDMKVSISANRILTIIWQDIEIAVNAADQHRVFDLLLCQGLSISISDRNSRKTLSFKEWQREAPSFSQFHDRRRTRLVTPIYELPATGDVLDDMLRPFIVVYSAEEVGLPFIAPPTAMTETEITGAYTTLSELNQDLALCNKGSEKFRLIDAIIPSFISLVKSEMHVLLMHAEPHSPVWGQHMAQLSELVHSRACVGGPDSLQELITDAIFQDFISWFQESLRGAADYDRLENLRASYRGVHSASADIPGSSVVQTAMEDDSGQD